MMGEGKKEVKYDAEGKEEERNIRVDELAEVAVEGNESAEMKILERDK